VTVHSFAESLAFSKGVVAETATDTIRNMIHGCVSVETYDVGGNDGGVDYIATLDTGVRASIDHKTRRRGSSTYWANGVPEIPIETISVGGVGGRCDTKGWTFDRTKRCQFVLFTFHPDDSDAAFLVPFQLLRTAAEKNLTAWDKRYGRKRQDNGRFFSECIFVPWPVVEAAVVDVMRGNSGSVRRIA